MNAYSIVKNEILVRPTFTPVASGWLQRACACGQHTAKSGGECEECKKRRQATLQRSAVNNSPTPEAPPIVHEVLRSAGQPLDIATRAFMEPRFGHDFSGVRVHIDAKAAESAQAMNALAYTVGRNIVFAEGQFTSQTPEGQRLIAHELAHVVQQRGATSTYPDKLENGSAPSLQEREASEASHAIVSERKPTTFTPNGPSIQRQAGEPIPVDLVPASPEEVKELKEKYGIQLPTVSEETWRLIGGKADNSGKSLSFAEKQKIQEILKKAGLPAATPLASVTGPKFLLHDTSAPVSAATIEAERKTGKGPLGKGVSAWVPRTGAATIARPDFFESKRPSTSEFEKGIDIIKQADREKAIKEIWAVTKEGEKDPAIERALAGTGLDADQITTLKKGAQSFFKGTADKDLPDGSKSTATWAVGELCAKAQSNGTATVALDTKGADFEAGCKKLATYFQKRTERVSSIVSVEIVQVGAKSASGNQNTCDPKNPNVKPMPSPPYSDEQYQNIALIYLRAALTAGSFPEITTHFVVDAFERGHCDPRCFDLQKLYNTIAILLGHGIGSTYGVRPNYGLTWGKNTIWWDDTICGSAPPK